MSGLLITGLGGWYFLIDLARYYLLASVSLMKIDIKLITVHEDGQIIDDEIALE